MRFSPRIVRVALTASALLFGLSVFAWVQAVRLPDYAKYWEWRDGWHLGVRNGGKLDDPVWWDTHAFVGQFPDRGVYTWPRTISYNGNEYLTDPYRWPDLDEKSIRILWPLLGSLVVPGLWILRHARKKAEVRGFPVGT